MLLIESYRTQLDCNSKQWRLFADVANDAKHFVQLIGPLLPVPFLVVMCLSAVMSALVGVAGGATRAAFSQHQVLLCVFFIRYDNFSIFFKAYPMLIRYIVCRVVVLASQID